MGKFFFELKRVLVSVFRLTVHRTVGAFSFVCTRCIFPSCRFVLWCIARVCLQTWKSLKILFIPIQACRKLLLGFVAFSFVCLNAGDRDAPTTCLTLAKVNGVPVTALIDTGSTVTLMSEQFAATLPGLQREPPTKVVKSLSNHGLELTASAKISLRLCDRLVTVKAHVMPSIAYPLLIGADSLRKYGRVVLDFQNYWMNVTNGHSQVFTIPTAQVHEPVYAVKCYGDVAVPPRSVHRFEVVVEGVAPGKLLMIEDPTERLKDLGLA